MNNINRATFFRYFLFTILFVAIPISFGLFRLYKNQKNLINYFDITLKQRDKDLLLLKKNIESGEGKFISSAWLDIQKNAKDTVVQVFSQVSRFNWEEPYKTPDQLEGAGSGFFINEDGFLLTNFHVVNQASSVQIQIPSFGRERFDATIIGVCPDRDIALLKLKDDDLAEIKEKLGKISYLEFGDSDSIVRTQKVLALGYPLGQERLKSTLGIVSGRERAGFIQITAPLNPGNSGGPCLNHSGQVIGINFAGIIEAQNVGYIIPINEVKNAVKDLYNVKLLRKPILGCIFTVTTPDFVKYLGNPIGGGWYIAQVFQDTILDEIGVKENDMLYSVNGYDLDYYGELSVPWSEDKIALLDFLNRFTVEDDIHFVIYRNGHRKDFNFKLSNKFVPPVRKICPEFEPEFTDYEIIGGMVIMQLTLNHIATLLERVPELSKYIRPEAQHEPAILITNVFPDSQARKARVLTKGAIIDEVNGDNVKTLADFRRAVKKSKESGYLTVKTGDKMFAALPINKILQDEDRLINRYFYKKSKLLSELA
ncbi:trypsin-like peptidase domain-containing protein [Candidatus Babeliales bacterium]|nr:trypsin-like peptidase domain-containing protein [Candidatus Babeliales bacterium]